MTPFDAKQRAREWYAASNVVLRGDALEQIAALLTAVRDEALEEAEQAGIAAVVKFSESYRAGNFIGTPTQQKDAVDSMRQGAHRVLERIRALKSKGEKP